MQIFIRKYLWREGYGNLIITLDVEKDDTIKKVKEKVIDREIYPCIHYLRFFRYSKSGKIFLENDKTLLDYNIQKESLIYLEIDYYLSKMKIQIFYNKNILDINECTTCFSSTVLDIKKMIKEKFKIKTNEIIIIYDDKILNDKIIIKDLDKMYLKFLVAKKRLPLVKVINGEDILMTFNLEIKDEHQSSIDIKKSIEKYYDLPTKNQWLFLEGGYEDNCYWCNFYREIENRSKKIIISENNSKRKKSGNKVEIYQIFLRLTENNLRTDLPLPKIINEEQDDENKEENEENDNINNNSINSNLKKKINNEEEEIGEQKMFRTIYTMKK